MKQSDRIYSKLESKIDYLPKAEVELIHQAYSVAKVAHEGQKRITGQPYITHPIIVAGILADMRMDCQTIMAALLHDVIEDTPITKEFLIEQFSQEVAELVDGVTKLTQIEYRTRTEKDAEYFRKMLMAMTRDIRVIIVKLADRLHNMRTLEPLEAEKRRRIARQTLDIFAPIANRLGMHDLCLELQDLGFKALYPSRYRVLQSSVRQARGNRKEIMSDIYNEIEEKLKKSHLTSYTLEGREKNIYSIYRKMKKKNAVFSDIMDVYALRIVVSDADNCYRALGIVHSVFKPVPERFKDYIAIPKANSYQSLHTTLFGPYGVPVEIQIRTEEMNKLANSGIAAHWLYKSDEKQLSYSHIRARKWVQNLLAMQESAGTSSEFLENMKTDLFPDEVYVFTPTGKIMELPVGATAVDFAYAVHTDLGKTCVAVKIDRQLAPLSTILSNGQTVEVITNPSACPNAAWLNFVVTAKARSSIRHFLKNQLRDESVSLGRQLFDRALAHYSLSTDTVSKTAIDFVLKKMGFTKLDDLLDQIGLGNQVAMLVVNRYMKVLKDQHIDVQQSDEGVNEAKPLLIRGTEGVVVSFASCCHPIPGDMIVGVLLAGQGVIIHMETCSKIQKLRHLPERCMPVRWAEDVSGEFEVPVIIEVDNRRGALAAIALSVADAGANIEDIHIDERDGQHFLVTLKLLVRDRVHLANAMRKLRRLKPIVRIQRTAVKQ